LPISPFFFVFFPIFPHFFLAKIILFECIIALLRAPNWPKTPHNTFFTTPQRINAAHIFEFHTFFVFLIFFRFLHFFFSTSIFLMVFISLMRTRNWAKRPHKPHFSKSRLDQRTLIRRFFEKTGSIDLMGGTSGGARQLRG